MAETVQGRPTKKRQFFGRRRHFCVIFGPSRQFFGRRSSSESVGVVKERRQCRRQSIVVVRASSASFFTSAPRHAVPSRGCVTRKQKFRGQNCAFLAGKSPIFRGKTGNASASATHRRRSIVRGRRRSIGIDVAASGSTSQHRRRQGIGVGNASALSEHCHRQRDCAQRERLWYEVKDCC